MGMLPWIAWTMTSWMAWGKDPVQGYYTDCFGWWVSLGLPSLAARMAATQSALRMRRVQRDKSQLVNDWGQTVAGDD